MSIDFMQFIADTNSADSADGIFHLFEKSLSTLGFDRVLYSLMTDHSSAGMKAGHGVVLNYPDEWMKHYNEKQYCDIDPVRRHVMLSSQPFIWDEMGKVIPYSREEKRLLNESQEAGLKCGIGLGVHCVNGESVGLGFASSTGGIDITQNMLSVVKALTNQFHFAYIEFHRKTGEIPSPVQTNLTRKEREVLSWCAAGKSLADIATILNISENSVDYYMRQIFAKLDVNSKIFAVVKGIKQGLIQV